MRAVISERWQREQESPQLLGSGGRAVAVGFCGGGVFGIRHPA
jgi:hypothetical protein